ncbi:MAG TPA: cold shock and DUF1294 domain-containing protein [Candidatus Binatia bacterium]|jgi:uncharacterized membrane protein YsdA (DUF1294 family)/cold shock CspA family protein
MPPGTENGSATAHSRSTAGADAAADARHTGRILKWNDERGFGFILPEDGGQTVFVHISGFRSSGRRPKEGDAVYFRIDREDRRTKAVDVRIKGLPLPDTVTVAYAVGALWLIALIGFLFDVDQIGWPVFLYLMMSVITFGFYYVDKKRAEARRWRITGTTLHVLEAVGGWPGALLAMAMLRHMTRKREHLTILSAIVVLHLVGWVVWSLYQPAG